MKLNKIGRLAVGMVVIGCTVLAAETGRADLRDRIERSFTVAPGGWLTLETDKGSIEVLTSPHPRVDVHIDLHADVSEQKKAERILNQFVIDISQIEKGVRIDAGFTSDDAVFRYRDGKHLKVRFVITVPRQYNLNLKTSGGGIDVSDLKGEVECRTSGGSLRFGNIDGVLNAKTSGGSIQLGGCTDRTDVHTSGGSIRIEKAGGPVKAQTSGGSIQVDEVLAAIDARTSGGSIEAYISRQPAAACSLKTSGGSINVYLAHDVGLDIDAGTSGGSVSTDFPVTVAGELKRSALKGKINAGGPAMVLRTSGGNIRLLKR